MIKALGVVFFSIAVFGAVAGLNGVALISIGMIAFVIYGGRQLDKRDREYDAAVAAAMQPVDTAQALIEQDTAASADRT